MLEEILLMHAHRYPLMEPQDAVKLVYQNEFGVGHLIADPDVFRNRLETEFAGAVPLPGIPLTEPIGNGLIRVMLNAAESHRLQLTALAEACLVTAGAHRGKPEHFYEKLEVLRENCRKGFWNFPIGKLETFLKDYAIQGYPMVSHSAVYRSAYHPAYRVISERCWREMNSDLPLK